MPSRGGVLPNDKGLLRDMATETTCKRDFVDLCCNRTKARHVMKCFVLVNVYIIPYTPKVLMPL